MAEHIKTIECHEKMIKDLLKQNFNLEQGYEFFNASFNKVLHQIENYLEQHSPNTYIRKKDVEKISQKETNIGLYIIETYINEKKVTKFGRSTSSIINRMKSYKETNKDLKKIFFIKNI